MLIKDINTIDDAIEVIEELKEKIKEMKCDSALSKSITSDQVFSLYNKICGAILPRCRILSDRRKAAVNSRIKDGLSSIELWEDFFRKVISSSFLTGKKTSWKASFDFLIKKSSYIKIIEGTYDDEDVQEKTDDEKKYEYINAYAETIRCKFSEATYKSIYKEELKKYPPEMIREAIERYSDCSESKEYKVIPSRKDITNICGHIERETNKYRNYVYDSQEPANKTCLVGKSTTFHIIDLTGENLSKVKNLIYLATTNEEVNYTLPKKYKIVKVIGKASSPLECYKMIKITIPEVMLGSEEDKDKFLDAS